MKRVNIDYILTSKTYLRHRHTLWRKGGVLTSIQPTKTFVISSNMGNDYDSRAY